MLRILFILLALLLIPSHGLALGLGDIRVNSSLAQPLDAEIGLISVGKAEIEDIRVKLADAVAFHNSGVGRPYFLTKLQFTTVKDSQGSAKVVVSSENAINEPFLHFIVQLSWPDGTMFREYALLLDPPDYNIASKKTQAEVSGQMAPAEKPTTESVITTYGPVKNSETLWVIAEKTRPDARVTVEQMMMALQRVNQQAFVDSNVNLLRTGSMLTIPVRAEINKTDAKTARSQFIQQSRAWRLSTQKPRQKEPGVKPAGADSVEMLASVPEPALGDELSVPKEDGVLRVVETGREWLLGHESHLGKEVYPSNLTEQLREEIADSEQDLAVVNDINRDLDDLKLALETKIDTLRTALDEKDQAIASLKRQLENAGISTVGQSGEGINSITVLEAAPGSVGISARPSSSITTNTEADKESKPFWLDERWIIMGVVIFIGLLILGFILLRKRQLPQSGPEADILKPASFQYANETASVEEGALLEDIFDETQDSDNTLDETATYHEPPADVAAVLTEADIYLAYRRYTQAENLIKDAMKGSPEDPELMAKLLEVYAFKKDRKMYNEYLATISEHLKSHSTQLWDSVLDMTRDLIPDHPLFFKDQSLTEEGELSTQHQEALELGDTLLIPDDHQESPDVSVDDLIVEGDDENSTPALAVNSMAGHLGLPSVEREVSISESSAVESHSSETIEDQHYLDEVVTESESSGFDFEGEFEDELIEHELFGLDVDFDFEDEEENK